MSYLSIVFWPSEILVPQIYYNVHRPPKKGKERQWQRQERSNFFFLAFLLFFFSRSAIFGQTKASELRFFCLQPSGVSAHELGPETEMIQACPSLQASKPIVSLRSLLSQLDSFFFTHTYIQEPSKI